MKNIKKFLLALALFFTLTSGVVYAQSVLDTYQGGTGIGTADGSDVGKCLTLLSVNSTYDFAYGFDTCGSGGGDSFWNDIGDDIYNSNIGNVGIRTGSPLPGTASLQVQGAQEIGSEEIAFGDFSTIEGSELITNGTFTGSATGWSLIGFAYNANNVTFTVPTDTPLILFPIGSNNKNFSVASQGTGYVIDDIVDVNDGTGGQVRVISVGGGGEAEDVTLETAGSGYTQATHTTTGGSGTGLEISVNTQQAAVYQSVSVTTGTKYRFKGSQTGAGGEAGFFFAQGDGSDFINSGIVDTIYSSPFSGATNVGYYGGIGDGTTVDNISLKESFWVGGNDWDFSSGSALHDSGNEITDGTFPDMSDWGGASAWSASGSAAHYSYVGAINTASDLSFIQQQGNDYSIDDELTIDAGNGDAVIKVTSVDGGGGISGFTILDRGTGYPQDTGGVFTGAYDLIGGTGTSGTIYLLSADALYQTGELVEGGQYNVSFAMTGTTGSVDVRLGQGGSHQTFSAANGNFQFTGSWHSFDSEKVIFYPSVDFDGTITNVVVSPLTDLYQPGELENGATYEVSFTVSGTTGEGTVCLDDGDCEGFEAGDGAVTFEGVYSNDNNKKINFNVEAQFDGAIDDVSIKQITYPPILSLFNKAGDEIFNITNQGLSTIFRTASTLSYVQSIDGNDAETNYVNTGDGAGAGTIFNIFTTLDTATGPARFILGVHDEGVDGARFTIRLQGDQGNTPDTNFQFPGAAIFDTTALTIPYLTAPSGETYMVTTDDTGLLSAQEISGGGGGSSDGSQYDIQMSDGMGGFVGDDNFQWEGNQLLIKGANKNIQFDSAGNHSIFVANQVTTDTDGTGLFLNGASGNGTGNGGTIGLTAGQGGVTSGTGGSISISAGTAQGGDNNGGDIVIQSGANSGAGAPGVVQLRVDNGSGGILQVQKDNYFFSSSNSQYTFYDSADRAILDTSGISTDRTYAFPDESGTLCTQTSGCGGASSMPGGADTNVQFNNSGSFDGTQDFIWNGSEVYLGYGGAQSSLYLYNNGGQNNHLGVSTTSTTSDTANGNNLIIGAGIGGSTSGTGGAVTVLGGNAQGGDSAGGNVRLQAGDGRGTLSGGDAQLVGGQAGDTGQGGGVSLYGAFGGATSGGGGSINLVPGSAQGTNSDGGELNLTSGSNTGAGSVGAIHIISASASGTDTAGGILQIRGGQGNGTASGGQTSILGGKGGDTGDGANLLLQAGYGGDTSGNGGSLQLISGIPSASGNGGTIFIEGSSAAGTNKNGGSISIRPGAKTGSGAAGTIFLTDPTTVNSLTLDTTAVTGNRIYTFPDNTGKLFTNAMSLIPATDNTYDLGDATHQWKDLYLTGASFYLGQAGVKQTTDGDGAITFLGLGNGSDEDLTINLDDTSNTWVFSSSTGVTSANFGAIGITAGSFTGNVTGNASTATALAADPADCATSTHFAVGILASGVATCEAIADVDVPNNITIDLATLASTVTVVDGTDATSFVAVFDSATGSLAAKTDGGLLYAADTGTLAPTVLSTATVTLTGTGTLNGLDAIDATGEATLEGVIDLQDLQGAVTDGQVPNTITIDLAAAATALANARTIGGVSFNGTANITVASATGNFAISNAATSSGILKILEDTDDGSNFATFQVPALAADTVYTLPPDDGDSGEQLQTNGSGVLTWESAGGVPTTITVADTTDSTSFCALFESATGDLGPKTDGGCLYDASNGTLAATVLSTATLTLTGTGTLNGLDAIDATGEATLEGVLDLQDMQGAVTDGQVPNNITIDLATLASTETVVDSTDATSFLAMFDSATGSLAVKTDGALLYDASAGVATTNSFTANTTLLPDANDGAAIGTSALSFSDLFLAEGGVINWDNGDATLTQTSNDITFAGISTFGIGTATTFTTGDIEVGAASDTTVHREAAGVLSIEGVNIPTTTLETNTSTSTSLTITSAQYGSTLFWSPAGTATATLPANGAAAGAWFDVILLTNQMATVSAATADTLITVNDTQADSISWGASNRIGATVRFISNGTVWIAINLGSTAMTVAT